jgi:hypothetical protein
MRFSTLALLAPTLVVVPLSQVEGVIMTRDDLADEYYADSPPFSLEGEGWLGLFESPDGAQLESVRPEWIAEGDVGDRSFKVSVGPRTPILLLRGVTELTEGPAVSTVSFTTEVGTSESPLEVTLNGATSILTLEPRTAPDCGGKVFLSDGDSEQELYSTEGDPFSCDEPRYDVNWAGDIDGDGRLDLVTTFSAKYSYHPKRVYLSSAAGPGDVVGQVAFFDGGE